MYFKKCRSLGLGSQELVTKHTWINSVIIFLRSATFLCSKLSICCSRFSHARWASFVAFCSCVSARIWVKERQKHISITLYLYGHWFIIFFQVNILIWKNKTKLILCKIIIRTNNLLSVVWVAGTCLLQGASVRDFLLSCLEAVSHLLPCPPTYLPILPQLLHHLVLDTIYSHIPVTYKNRHPLRKPIIPQA